MQSMHMQDILRNIIERVAACIVDGPGQSRQIIVVELHEQTIENIDGILIIPICELDSQIHLYFELPVLILDCFIAHL